MYTNKEHKVFTKTILLVGDGGVGKTEFISRLFNNKFNLKYNSTYGSVLYSYYYQGVKYNIIDTAGQETGADLSYYYKMADAVIMMFDMNSRLSFKNLRFRRDIIRKFNKDIKLFIVGNKCEISRYRFDNKIVPDFIDKYFEISTKTGKNFDTTITNITKQLIS